MMQVSDSARKNLNGQIVEEVITAHERDGWGVIPLASTTKFPKLGWRTPPGVSAVGRLVISADVVIGKL
jgi:hypothetical protein